MTETTTVSGALEALKEDHRRLHGLVRSLREAPDLPHLVVALEQLHEDLARHFQQEENPGGLYDALGVCAPEFRVGLGQLVDDHFRLAAQIRDLRDKARELVLRTHIFYENAVNRILRDLVAACHPLSMTVRGEFTPRGGILRRVEARYTHPQRRRSREK